MNIVPQYYIHQAYIESNTPSISVDYNSGSTVEIANRIKQYQIQAETFANEIKKSLQIRNYIVDRLGKDMCAELGLSTINKETNEYIANIKADNYFNQVKGNNNVFTNEETINEMYDNFVTLKSNFFDDEQMENISYTGNWDTGKYLPATIYDNMAIKIKGIIENQTGTIYFIKNIANSENDDRVFTAYQTNNEYNINTNPTVEQYIPKYTLSKIDNIWRIKNSNQQFIGKVTTDIDTNQIIWYEIFTPNESATITINNNEKDYILSNLTTSQTINATAKSICLNYLTVNIPKDIDNHNQELNYGDSNFISDGLDYDAMLFTADRVEINNLNFDAYSGKKTVGNESKNTNRIKCHNTKQLIIRNTTFTGTTFNTIMTGQMPEIEGTKQFIEQMLIDNCNFDENCQHINVWFAGHADNAVLTISNCHFRTSDQFLCISDFANPNNKLTVNIINCTIDNYDNSYLENWGGYGVAGFMFIESRNIGDKDTVINANPFGNGKLIINIKNLIVNNTLITKNNFYIANGEKNQSMYYYYLNPSSNESLFGTDDKGCFIYSEQTKHLFPTINIQ